jgi:threonylcarbamoyladenosine tRNA methylthiotransferase MtaB
MKYAITTLGCKVNQYETQAMEAILRERGHEPAGRSEADAVIVNTCAVTLESARKSRQAFRRLKLENPRAVAVLCGCFPQISPAEAKNLGADIVSGSGGREELIDNIEKALITRERIADIDDPFSRTEFENLPAGSFSGRTRAMLKIQDGCSNFCAYCAIPYARGYSRSLPVKEAAKQAGAIKAKGFAELVITGIEISSYGMDLKDGSGLIDAIEAIAVASPGMRLRLGSLEPTIVTEDFCRRLSKIKELCRHFHLSLQSGCDEVLERMNRKYTTADFYKSVCLLREYFPGCAVAADLIVGFPGESEAQHQKTMEFIKKCAFASMHIFPYSLRPGTVAADMEGQLTKAVKEKRAGEAKSAAADMKEAYMRRCIGSVLPVLFETSESGKSIGHADNYCRVSVDESNLRSLVKNVQIETICGEILVGKTV